MLLNNRCMDKKDTNYHQNMNYDNKAMASECCDNQFPGVVCPPIYECPQIRCCHREIYHEVPQD